MLIQAPPGLLQGAFETTQNRAIQYMRKLSISSGRALPPCGGEAVWDSGEVFKRCSHTFALQCVNSHFKWCSNV